VEHNDPSWIRQHPKPRRSQSQACHPDHESGLVRSCWRFEHDPGFDPSRQDIAAGGGLDSLRSAGKEAHCSRRYDLSAPLHTGWHGQSRVRLSPKENRLRGRVFP
jgi:hypothetical protein